MANNYLDKNGLLYLWQKIKDKFVAKESGKGLSTNDFTTTLKNKLDGIQEGANKYTLPIASAETLGGVKVGAGLEINPSTGTLSATGGGTADAVSWNNVTDKPATYPPATHNHDSEYLKLSGGQMTGPIQFAPGQAQIEQDTDTAVSRIELDEQAAEIIYTRKTANKTNRMTVSSSGAVIAVGETTPGDGTGTQITIDETNGVKIPDVIDPVDNRDAANKQYVDQKVTQGTQNKADKATTLAGYGITDAYTKTELDGKLSSTYKPGGSSDFASLPTPDAAHSGMVYSMTEGFTTDERFIEGAGKQYPIGTNVAVIQVMVEDTPEYKFDVLAGFVDLSGYMQKTDMVAITNEEIDQIVGDSAA